MNLVGYIVAGAVIVILLLVYGLLVLSYLGSSKGYREAKRADAVIIEDLGDMKMATGNITIGVPRFRVFHKYKVSFWVDGQEYIEDAELKNRKLKVGDHIEIRYHISKEGRLKLKSEAFLCWSKEMAIGYTLGILLGIVLSVLKAKDMI